MEVPMLGSIGITEWVAAMITFWLAAQLPLGILVGFYLRRATVLSTIDAAYAVPVRLEAGRRWQELFPVPAFRAIPPAL